MIKFLVGVLGAIIFAAIAWFVMVSVLDMEQGVLQYIIAGVVTFFGFSIAQEIYKRATKKDGE